MGRGLIHGGSSWSKLVRYEHKVSAQMTIFSVEDPRTEVRGDDLRRAPYKHIVAVVVDKRCCAPRGHTLGTCFLVDTGDGSGDEYCYYLTAGHVLYCNKHGMYADSIKLLFAGYGQTIAVIGPSEQDSGDDAQPGWFLVSPDYIQNRDRLTTRRAHDLGVIAVRREKISERFSKGGLRVQASLSPDSRRCHGFMSGYPVQVRHGRSQSFQPVYSLYMYKSPDEVCTQIDTLMGEPTRLWSHQIASSGGQAGSPIMDVGTGAVVGMHIGFAADEHDPHLTPTMNVAVVLDQQRVQYVTSAFGERVNVEDKSESIF